MSFYNTVTGQAYAPGWFLADNEHCTRLTRQISAEDGVDGANGGKYVPMGTLYTESHEEEVEGVTTTVTDYIGLVYEDVDVTNGDMPGSVVLSGKVYLDRLPDELDAEAQAALEAKGFEFIATSPAVTRPWDEE